MKTVVGGKERTAPSSELALSTVMCLIQYFDLNRLHTGGNKPKTTLNFSLQPVDYTFFLPQTSLTQAASRTGTSARVGRQCAVTVIRPSALLSTR